MSLLTVVKRTEQKPHLKHRYTICWSGVEWTALYALHTVIHCFLTVASAETDIIEDVAVGITVEYHECVTRIVATSKSALFE